MMVDLADLLRELERRVVVDVEWFQGELRSAETDHRFGWQQRGKDLRRGLAEQLDLLVAVRYYLDALT